MRAIAIKLILALHLLGGVLAGISTENGHTRRIRGWNLVPVVVVARPLKAGTVLDPSMVTTKSIPEEFVTSSVVKPDSSGYVQGGRLAIDLDEGAPLWWAQVSKPSSKSLKECLAVCARLQTRRK